jgi:hypothetical protein
MNEGTSLFHLINLPFELLLTSSSPEDQKAADVFKRRFFAKRMIHHPP